MTSIFSRLTAYTRALSRSIPVITLSCSVIAVTPAAVAQTSSDREVLDALNLEQLGQEAAALPRLHSLLISHRGERVFEQYYAGRNASQAANMKSASKSVISALVGIALEEGYISSVDTPVSEFFPEYASTDERPESERLTIRHLLTMQAGLESTSGRNYGRWVVSDDWVETALSRPYVAEPGSRMIYSTGSTHILSAIITRASGMSTRDFAQQYLASPMGFRLAYWSQDPQGIYFGGNDMEITPRQMLAFGELYLNNGRYNGSQVLSEEWVEQSHQSHAVSPRGQGRYYGYGWWLRDMADMLVPLAWGYGGQLIFVIREYDLVIVATSDSNPGTERSGHLRQLYGFVENRLLSPLPRQDNRIF